MKPTIAIDMDNVIVDIETNWSHWYAKEFGVHISKDSMRGIPEEAAFPDPGLARSLLNKPGFFRHAPVMEGAIDSLRELMNDYEVYIVSAAMEFPNSLLEKHDWIKEHLPFISWKNIILCGSKSVIGTDYMIDDHLKNLDFFKGTPILYTAGHNILVDKYTRVNSWVEVLAFFRKERLK